ncbi:MAG: hypothetical protein WAN51_04415 [Alphaproteobacteria bacterium]
MTAFFLAIGLVGCSHDSSRPQRPEYTGILYSPNGEPLSGGALGHPVCANALSAWFDRVDGNHDGRVDADEFMMDARRQFAAMDLDHTGVITASELARYRAPYEETVPRQKNVASNEDGEEPDEQSASGNRRSRHGGQSGGGQRAAAGGPADMSDSQPDPVMSADIGLRFEVHVEDFLAYAQQKFSTLDRDRNGTLDRNEVVASCPKP